MVLVLVTGVILRMSSNNCKKWMNKNIMNRADETQEIEKSPAEESEVVEEPKPV